MTAGPAPGEVALFGGSFDPPHVGHVLAAAYAVSVGFGGVLVVPALAHAFGKHLALFEHRLAMAELSFGWLRGVSVSSIEAGLGAPSRTLRTVEELLRTEPGRRLRLMVGADVLTEKDSWHLWDRVIELAPPFILGRAGVRSSEAPVALLPEISSTSVRALLRGESGKRAEHPELQRLVPAAVLRYIDDHDLYRETPG